MSKVKVYKVRKFIPDTGEYFISSRMMTEKGAVFIKWEMVPESEIEIDKSQLEHGEEWTKIDFVPH